MIQLNPTLCEETNRIQMSLVHFGHAVLGTEWKGSDISLDASQLYYIVKGSASVLCNGKQLLTMEAGNWYLLPSGTLVTYWCDEYMEEIYFHLNLCDLDRIDLLKSFPEPCSLKIKEDMTDFFLSCIDSQNLMDGIRLRQVIYSVLLEFIDAYGVTFKKTDLSPCVSKAIAYMNQHLSMNLTLSEIVESAFVSKSTLEKKFREELGVSVHEYLLDTTLSEAGQLLLKTDLPVGAISERFGFCDQFYFSKCFKGKFGKSPKEFRKTISM